MDRSDASNARSSAGHSGRPEIIYPDARVIKSVGKRDELTLWNFKIKKGNIFINTSILGHTLSFLPIFITFPSSRVLIL